VSDAEKTCPCCGKVRPEIGVEASDEIELVPAKVIRKRHLRRKYGSCPCEGFTASGESAVVTAPAPPKIVPRSAFSNSTIAFFLASKFCDAIPFYRMEKMLARNGLDMSSTTLCNLAVGPGAQSAM